MSDLNDFIKKSSHFLKILPNVTEVFTILSYNQGISNISGKPTVFYKIKMADGMDTEKIFQTASVNFAKQVIALPNQGVNCKVEVKREGEGLQTKYTVKALGASSEGEIPF